MSIDPQRHLAQVHALQQPHREEATCPGCGRRTRDQTGRCRLCRAAGMGASLDVLTDQQLLTVVRNAKAEIARRAARLAEALEDLP